jgi:hypothetical protein
LLGVSLHLQALLLLLVLLVVLVVTVCVACALCVLCAMLQAAGAVLRNHEQVWPLISLFGRWAVCSRSRS